VSTVAFTLVCGAAPMPGAGAFYSALLMDAAHVVAADGAAEWCVAHGRRPDVAVGDFDSALPGAAERLVSAGVEVLTYPREKDETDLEIALDVALQRSTQPVVITAAFTERIDHTLAALGVLMRAGSGARVEEPDWTGAVVRPGEPLEVPVGAGVAFSVIAPGGASGVEVAGARWPLSGAVLDPLSGRGVSNVTSGEILRVSAEKGTLIVLIRRASGRSYTR